MTAFGKENSESVLITVEGKVLADEFVDYQIFVGEVGSAGGIVVEGAEYLCSDFGSDLREDSSFFESLLEDFF